MPGSCIGYAMDSEMKIKKIMMASERRRIFWKDLGVKTGCMRDQLLPTERNSAPFE